MWKLIKIEYMKIFHRKSIWISLIICCIAIIGFGFLLTLDSSDLNIDSEQTEEEQKLQEDYENSTDWKEQLEIQMKLNTYLETIYSSEHIDAKNQLLQYKIDHNLKPYGKNTTWDFISYTFQIIGFLLSVFGIIIATEIVCTEYSQKTTKLLFTKPYKRAKILVSKYLSALLYIVGLGIFIYIVSLIVGGIFFTFKGGGVYTAVLFFNSIFKCTFFAEGLIYFVSTLVSAVIVTTIAFLLCVICKSQTMPLITSLGILLFGNMIAEKLYSVNFKMIRFSILSYINPANYVDCYVSSGYSVILMIVVILVHLLLLLWGAIEFIKRCDL